MITKNSIKNDIISDIKYGYEYLLQTNNKSDNQLLSITIENTGLKVEKHLRFILTNNLLNTIRKSNPDKSIDYLFVIEYNTETSMGNFIPKEVSVHAHLVISTNIDQSIFKDEIENLFDNPNVYIEDIKERNDKENYSGYLIKQGVFNYYLLNKNSYNYKIS